jgi:hypothetical protein
MNRGRVICVTFAPEGSSDALRTLSQRARNSPDNFADSACGKHAQHEGLHSAYAVDTPKMPGEPPRVQPSRKRKDTNDISDLDTPEG